MFHAHFGQKTDIINRWHQEKEKLLCLHCSVNPHLDEIVHYQLQGLLSFVGSATSKTDRLKEKVH